MKFKFSMKSFVAMIIAVVWFLVLVIGVESFLLGSYDDAMDWVKEMPAAYILNALIGFALFLVLLGIINRFLISFIVTNLVVILLPVFSYFKFSFLGENLYPWDLLLYNNVLNLLPNIYKQGNVGGALVWIVVVLAVLVGLFVYMLKKRPRPIMRLPWWVRVIFVGMGAVYLCAFIFYRTFPNMETALKDAKMSNITFNQEKNYETNGFYGAFMLNMQSAIVLAPNGYSKGAIEDIVKRLEKDAVVPNSATDKKPNIIFVMNESFWDPTLLEKIQFDPDPMPFIRENQTGWLLSPTFGGGTSNVEFEVLTGFSNNFLPVGSVPYQQYVKDKQPAAMPNYLKGLGYDTLAIHPYAKWFWNRETVYKHFGFNEFLDDKSFTDPIYKGPFISDEQVTKTIIERTEASDDPMFIYAVTMQNHTGYAADKYEKFDVKTTVPEGVDDVYNVLLRSFTQGVYDADKALEQLIHHYKDSDEPTVVAFFGDHLPAIGQDYRLYKVADFVPRGAGESQWDLGDFEKTRSTPLLMWNNFDAPIPDIDHLSPNQLGPTMFTMAGIRKPVYYELLEQFGEKMPGFTREVKIDADGNLSRETPAEVKKLSKDYQLMQYDLLFGKQYGKDAVK
ncbi:LTA synthase family protein [Sporosarcina aquimarina]|uniref:Sulfatase-like hydrolase/transferase n=1 Tax=Sporosarcina aquimarina TaxID=114975 RepID=A0ABU4FXK6_9BACL|nr:sulfatase-like hydrolase/transferase [Sporosarcina aquimarina]MDW0108857.1 sulfatase-like hydrolase/transferase [Sporosarcina aquimarina]